MDIEMVNKDKMILYLKYKYLYSVEQFCVNTTFKSYNFTIIYNYLIGLRLKRFEFFNHLKKYFCRM